jgi:hypothetical protein
MTTHVHLLFLKNPNRIVSMLLISAFLLSGCGAKTAALQAVPPTATVPPQPTATQTAAPTSTPLPTHTSVPTDTPTPDVTATTQAQATAAAATVMLKVQKELDKVGVDASEGQLVWHSDADTVLSATKFDETETQALEGAGSLTDFVLHADIGWNSSSGLAGCGFIFRADDDLKRGKQYQMLLVRLQSLPGWLVDFYQYGKFQFAVNPDDEPQRVILDQPDSVNKITLVARGQDLLTYINGEKMRLLESNKQLEGIAAFMVYQESGKTSCTFSNSWVYSLKK